MTNTKISALPTYTGDTTGVYAVMNDSGNTTTYKVLNSNLGPSWVSDGALFPNATTTTPTVGVTSKNNMSYYQIGPKLWQVVMSFQTTGQFGAAGSGDYLFRLPITPTTALNFDTTKPWQTIYTSNVGTSNIAFAQNTIPSGSGMISDNGTSVSSYFQPVVWDASRFRLMVHIPGVKTQCMGSGFWQLTANYGFNITFQFTST